MCAQPSLPVVPDNSAASRGDGDSGIRNNEESSKGVSKKPGVALGGPKKPPLVLGGPRPPSASVNNLRLQSPKKPDQKVCSPLPYFRNISYCSTSGPRSLGIACSDENLDYV